MYGQPYPLSGDREGAEGWTLSPGSSSTLLEEEKLVLGTPSASSQTFPGPEHLVSVPV